MRKPIVSVVMPVYNGAKHLREAMDSILTQSLADLELIVVNDGSTDRSRDILDACSDKRVRAFHQEKMGISAALNKGLVEARGKYIARMDSDDISLPERLQTQVAFMESHPDVGVCGTGWGFQGLRRDAIIPRTEDKDIRAAQLFWPSIAHPTAMMRRGLIVKHNLYYANEFTRAEDYEYWLRFARPCKMANIPEMLLLYRVCGEQASCRHESEVHRWSCVVHREAIARLGIETTDDDVELHRSLAGAPISQGIERAEAWLLRLVAANESARIYDSQSLRRILFECWYSFCSRSAESGTWTWPAFRKSSLTDGFRIPTRYAVSFVVRYALRHRTRAAYYRLSRFNAVWRTVAVMLPRTGGASS